jgi:hypothetical protein
MLKTLRRWVENIVWLLNHPAKVTEDEFNCQYCGNRGNISFPLYVVVGERLEICASCLKKVMDSVLIVSDKKV